MQVEQMVVLLMILRFGEDGEGSDDGPLLEVDHAATPKFRMWLDNPSSTHAQNMRNWLATRNRVKHGAAPVPVSSSSWQCLAPWLA